MFVVSTPEKPLRYWIIEMFVKYAVAFVGSDIPENFTQGASWSDYCTFRIWPLGDFGINKLNLSSPQYWYWQVRTVQPSLSIWMLGLIGQLLFSRIVGFSSTLQQKYWF